MTDLPEHVAENRRYWDAMADEWVAMGERAWSAAEPTWGQWGAPDDEVRMLPADMTGMRAIDLGCGTGYVSAWMTRRGATVTAIDNSQRQLGTAKRLAAEHGLEVEWIHGNAERVPAGDGTFDFAVSEYGASTWADPAVWLAEAHRLLRPGGELAFLANHWLVTACSPVDGSIPIGYELVRPLFGMYRQDWRDAVDEPGGIEFTLSPGGWIRQFNQIGFEILDYVEIQAPPEATGTPFVVPAEWAKHFPSEFVWRVRRR